MNKQLRQLIELKKQANLMAGYFISTNKPAIGGTLVRPSTLLRFTPQNTGNQPAVLLARAL
jgi:hypothetical protein